MNERGFTLIEMAIVVMIVALLLGGMLVPLNTQVDLRRISETNKAAEEIKETLIGFSVANKHLPCPDTDGDGAENVDAAGICTAAGGDLPWATLGIAATDPWGQRYIYRVTPEFANRTPATVFTLDSVGNNRVCATAACAAPRLTDNAAVVILSKGKNLGNCVTCLDELENIPTNTDFVSRDMVFSGANEFDDIVTWLSPNILFNRMVAAGRLP